MLFRSLLGEEVAAANSAEGVNVEAPAGSAVFVDADAAMLRQALDNVVRNAVHRATNVRIETIADGRLAVVRITDDGPGFPAALLAQGTRRFRRSDSAGAVGIGLSIVQTIVGAHHGSVRLANRPGGGAEVSIVLPLRDV